MKVNLHTHSTASDGTMMPKDLVRRLAYEQVDIFALTDHDTLDGIEEAQLEAKNHNIRLISGIEISTKISGLNITFLDETKHTLHILALNFDVDKLRWLFQQRDKAKEERLHRLVKQLNSEGFNIEVPLPLVKKTQVARKLVEQNYATDIQNAFNMIINKHYDRNLDHMTIDDVITMVHLSNGKVIWAHPYEILNYNSKVTLNEAQIELIIAKLKDKNIDGIEAYYEAYSVNQKDILVKMADKYNLIKSGGTDFHGKPNRSVPYIDIDENLIKEVLR